MVNATDLAGNTSSSEVSFEVGNVVFSPDGTNGWGAKSDSTVILGEQDSYVLETSVPVQLGLETNDEGEQVGSRTISFDVDAVWGELNAAGIEDRLLVYLVDPANPPQTLLDSGSEGTPVFSVSGEQADFTPGLVGFDGSRVTIDASSLTDLEEGLLVFQLLNQDDDTSNVVTVNNLSSTTDPEGFANPVFPQDNNLARVGGELNLDNLTATTDVEPIFEKVSFDVGTGEYRARVSLQNNGETAISRNSVVVFENLPEGVELVDASGTNAAGNPYMNLRPAIRSGGLDAGAISDSIEVVFSNPNLIRFPLNPTVLVGSPNVAPVFEPIEDLTVIPGDKLNLTLSAIDPNGDRVTYRLESEGELPTGELSGDGTLRFSPQPDELGSYEFTVIATDGSEEVSQTVILDVVADPVSTTRISGVIENVELEPLAGVPIELGELKTITAADGSFTIESDEPLTADTLVIRGEEIGGELVYPYIAEKLPLVLGQEVFTGFNNVIDRPIYLPALDVDSGQVIDPTVDTTVTTENIPEASVFVEAGSLSTQSGEMFTGTLSITEVPPELTPAALPENLSPDLVITVQPGEMVFNTPAPLNLPNLAGYEPGTEMDLWSINPETGDFDNVGTGVVSDDGSTVETIDGGIRNSSWHFFSPPPEEQRDPEEETRNEDNRCPECTATAGFTSEVEFHSGAVIETHNLTSYSSNGEDRGITLTYDSLRSNPQPIVHFGYDNIGSRLNPNSKLVADLTIQGNGFEYQVPGFEGGQYGLDGGEHFWSIPNQSGDLSVGLQADMRELPSGLYDYTVNSGVYLFSNNVFTGSSDDETGDFIHVNTIDSDFGSGWSIAGWQEIVENSDDSVLLIDGDGGELLFESEAGESGYISPPGDFSTLEKLPDGTFKRTTTDQMVYVFNSANNLESVTDRNGNQTSYIYNTQQQLSKIVDPVGLETLLTYNEAGNVSTITDPGERETQLEYDEVGNLIQITDPDGTTRTWSYDDNRLMVSEVDQRGNQEQAFYDQFGRANNAILKDDSTVKIDPLQTQGLYNPEATVNPFSAPLALVENEAPTAAYLDSNGNVTVTEVDRAGQVVKSLDGQGNLPSVERDEQNLISAETDGRGFETSYTYDENGNITSINDSLSYGQFVDISTTGEPLTAVNGNDDRSVTFELPFELEFYGQNYTEVGISSNGLLSFGGTNSAYFNQSLNSASQLNNLPSILPFWDDLETRTNEGVAASVFTEVLGTPGNRQLTIQWHQLEAYSFGSQTGDITFQVILNERIPEIQLNYSDVHFTDSTDRAKGEGRSATVGIWNSNTEFLEYSFNQPSLRDGLSLLVTEEEIVEFDSSGAAKGSQLFTYDPIFNQVTSYTDELGRQTLYDIDPSNGNTLSITEVVGEVGGDDDLITSYTYTDTGLVDTMTDPEGRIIGYVYDDSGRLIKETHAVGTPEEAFTSYEYDDAGNQTAVIDENGNRTEFKYDNKNRVTEIIEADPDGEGELTSPISTSIYDESGNLIEKIDARNNFTQHEYDELNRKTKTINALGQETSYEYDDAGNIIAVIDAEGRKIKNKYDSRDRLVETIDAKGNSTKYRYDLNNNVVAIIDPLGNITRNIYDSRDRLFRTIDGLGNVTNYEYDGADNIIATVDAEGNRTEFEYDELDRQLKRIDAIRGEFTTAYDKVSNIISTTDAEGRTTQLDYDSRDRLTSTTNAENDVAGLVYDDAGNLISITDESGRTTSFGYDALNRRVSITDPLGNATTSVYDAVDNLVSVTDANDNTTSFSYDALNRPEVVKNAAGDSVETEYDAVGNVESVTDELGRTINFAYDERDLPISVTDPLGNSTITAYDEVGNVESITDARGNITTYEYDKLYRLINEIDALNGTVSYQYDGVGNLNSVTDELGRTTSFGYDALNRRTTITDPLSFITTNQYDGVGNLISVTDANDHSTTFSYDNLNRPVGVTNARGDSTVREYDGVGNVVSVTDELGRVTTFNYDERNLQTSLTDALNNTTALTYDPVGNLTSVTDANNHTTSYSYDELNRRTDITNPVGDTFNTEYDAVDNVISVTDESGRTTSFAYDERNLQTGVTNALNNVTTTQYDEVGNIKSITDARGNTTSYNYDSLNRETVKTNALGDTVTTEYDAVDNVVAITDELDRTTTFGYDERNYQTSVTDPLEHTTSSTYDGVGNLASVTDANDHTTTYAYDELDRQIGITDPLDQTKGYTYDRVSNLLTYTDELNRTTTYSYDNLDRITSVTDPLDRTTTNIYDPVGNLLSVTDPIDLITTFDYDSLDRQTSVTNPNGETTSYTYDSVSNQLSITDPENNTTSYTYDNLNRTLTDTNQLGHTRSYEYDLVGNVIQTSDRNGREIGYTYDPLNRNTAENWLDEAGNSIRTFEFKYDAASQLTSASDPDSSYSYTYDGVGRVTSVDNAGTSGVPNVVFDYTYDPVDNQTQVNDSIEGVDKGVETFAYDELNRVTSITQSGNGVADKRVDMSYDAASQMRSTTRYSDNEATELVADTNYTYDDASRITEIVHQHNSETLAEFGLVYDNGDRITSFTTPDGVSEYSYDNNDQLTGASHDYQDNENYSYDDNGNRTNDGYVTGDNNQLTSDGTYNYEYDNEGNRVKKTEIATGEVTEYEWDYRNRLVDVETTNSDGNVIANSDYTYDVFDNRIGKSVDADGSGAGSAIVERYVLDGDHIALTFDGSGNMTERFLHGLQIDSVLAQENAGGEVLWALADNQGSARILLDNQGNVVNEISYDAFGNITLETNDNVNFRGLYTGRESDSETGLNYNRGRYYDPITGRFISIDPIGFAAGDSNLYRYVGNNPLFYIDPSGFCGVASGGAGNDGGEPEFFGPAFGPGSSGEPGSSSNNDVEVIEAGIAIPIVRGLQAATIIAAEMLRRQQQQNPDENEPISMEEFQRQLDREERRQEPNLWERIGDGFQQIDEFLQDTFEDLQQNADDLQDSVDRIISGDDSGEFDPNNINRDRQQTEPLTDLKTPPQNTDNLDGQTDGYPDGEYTDPSEYVERFPTGIDEDLEAPVLESSEPWRETPTIQDGNSRKGWQHIDARHVTGNNSSGDLFAPGTTRAQVQDAAERVVDKGTRISDPSNQRQVFEDRIKVNGKRDRVRVVVDTTTGDVITIFPVRSE